MGKEAEKESEKGKGADDDFDVLAVVVERQNLTKSIIQAEDELLEAKRRARQDAVSHQATQEDAATPCKRRPAHRPALSTGAEEKQEERVSGSSEQQDLDILKVVRQRVEYQAETEDDREEDATAKAKSDHAPTRVGAYAEAFGEEAQRAEALRYSLVGAVASQPIMQQQDSSSRLTPLKESEQVGTHTTANPFPRQDEELAVAHRVSTTESENMPKAHELDEVSLHTIESQKEERRQESQRKTVLALALLCLIVVGMALIVVWLVGGFDGLGTPSMAGNHSLGSSNETALQQFASRAEYVMSLLPQSTLDAIQNRSFSPQATAFLWTTGDPNLQDLAAWQIQQRFALVTFYFASGGIGWIDNVGATSYGIHECDWFPDRPSICKAGTNRIDHLHLPSNRLEGTLPEELYMLTDLEHIKLDSVFDPKRTPTHHYNQLNGTIATLVGKLTKLTTLSLNGNHLSGKLPTEMGQLTNLVWLELGENHFSGRIPTELGLLESLQHMGLGMNEMSGHIPSSFGMLQNLHFVHFGANSFTGQLPTALGNLVEMEEFLGFNNSIEGTIPTEIFGLWQKAHTIELHRNLLTGSLHTEVGNLIAITTLQLHENMFSGQLPSEVGLLQTLTGLSIYQNELSSSIPTHVGKMASLYYLNMHSNGLTGALPSQLGNLGSLSFLLMQNCNFTGTLPTELGLLTELHSLFLNDNTISGVLPSQMARLTKVSNLVLSNNCLTSTIPNSLWETPNKLETFWLDNNRLNGTLPIPLAGGMQNLESLSIYNNTLSSTLPSQLGLLSHLQYLLVHDNKLVGTLPSQIGSCKELGALLVSQNAGLKGTIPSEIGGLVGLNGTGLYAFRIAGCSFEGELPSQLCLIHLSFDCSPTLCGCNCSCAG